MAACSLATATPLASSAICIDRSASVWACIILSLCRSVCADRSSLCRASSAAMRFSSAAMRRSRRSFSPLSRICARFSCTESLMPRDNPAPNPESSPAPISPDDIITPPLQLSREPGQATPVVLVVPPDLGMTRSVRTALYSLLRSRSLWRAAPDRF